MRTITYFFLATLPRNLFVDLFDCCNKAKWGFILSSHFSFTVAAVLVSEGKKEGGILELTKMCSLSSGGKFFFNHA